MDANTLVDRKMAIRDATVTAYVKQRIAQAAEEMSRAVDFAARCELLIEVFTAFVHLVYVKDPDGHLANVDFISKRILIPSPFGSSGWQKWNLRLHEGRLLRRILANRQADDKRQPMFVYRTDTNQWHVNTEAWPAGSEGFYLQRCPITIAEMRQAA